MSADNFDKSFALTLRHEGGYVDHPRDPGGATNLGITIGTLSQWLGRKASKAEVKALTPDSVKPIYRKKYWDAIRGDDLPRGLDYALYDFAVNSGPQRAVMALQRALGVADDGDLGPVTLQAVGRHTTGYLIERLCTDRLSFLQHLQAWPVFGRGWKSRVVNVEKEALKMVTA